MLLVANHDLRDPDLLGLLECAHEQPVRLLAAVLGEQVVGLAEVDGVDLVQADEVTDLDRPRELDVEPVEIFVLKGNVASLLNLEAADDILVVDVLAAVAPDLVVADRLQVALVEEVKAQLLRLRRGVHAHGHTDEARPKEMEPLQIGRATSLAIPLF